MTDTAGLLSEIARRMENGAAPDDRKWSALGVFTAAMLDPTAEATQDLIRRLPRSWAGQDPYLQEILRIVAQGRPPPEP